MTRKNMYMTISGIRMHVTVQGKGPDVMLLHGFPDSSRVWRNQIPALISAGFRVIVPDLRGCGNSDAPAEKKAYAIDNIISDILEIMKQLDVTTVRLVAHDWGANIGWILAARHPQLVDRYIALSVGHTLAYRRSGPRQVMRAWYAALFLLPGISEMIFRAFDWKFLRMISDNHPETEEWIGNLSRPGRLRAGIRWYRDNALSMLTVKTPNVQRPCIGIWSDGDNFLTEKQMRDSEKYVDDSWLYHRVEGAGHWMQLDAPERVNRLLVQYLKMDGPDL